LDVWLPGEIKTEMVTVSVKKGNQVGVIAGVCHKELDSHYKWDIALPRGVDMKSICASGRRPSRHMRKADFPRVYVGSKKSHCLFPLPSSSFLRLFANPCSHTTLGPPIRHQYVQSNLSRSYGPFRFSCTAHIPNVTFKSSSTLHNNYLRTCSYLHDFASTPFIILAEVARAGTTNSKITSTIKTV